MNNSNKNLVGGISLSVHHWRKVARRNGIPDAVYMSRVQNNWEHERAATDSIKDKRVSKIFNQKEREIMRKSGISLITASRRFKSGNYTKEEAITKPIRGRGHELLPVRTRENTNKSSV